MMRIRPVSLLTRLRMQLPAVSDDFWPLFWSCTGLGLAFWAALWVRPLGFIGHMWAML